LNENFSPKWPLFSIFVLLAGAAWIWPAPRRQGVRLEGASRLLKAGFLAPDFLLKDPQGETFQLAELAGQPVLVNLWASWCPPCRAEMPAMQRVYEEYQAQGFVILAVNATDQDNLNAANAFVESLGLTFPILLDPSGEVSAAYEVRALPSSFFIDREGIIREVVVGGPMSEALLRIRVQQILEMED
jgi:cytochrome c biogenesis protein CcmG, thiol:disulfide interchange protein DsbE